MGKKVLCFLGTALVKSPGVPAIVGVSAILANLLHHEPALADGCPEPFAAVRTLDAGTSPKSVAVSDFNGDGKPDLAVVGSTNVSILLGKGDGTFQAPVSYGAGTNPVSVAVGQGRRRFRPAGQLRDWTRFSFRGDRRLQRQWQA